MSSAFQAISGAATTARPLVRLDLVANPYGPVDPIIDAVSRFDGWGQSFERHATRLRARLGALAGVNDDWVVLANGIDELHAMIAQWRNDHGPLVLFPPSDPGLERWLGHHSNQVEAINRERGFGIPVAPGQLTMPRGATSIVMSPNDPTGTILTVQDAVRLSRQSALVVIDERHAAYSLRSLTPLVREFENLVVLQTFETFAGMTAFPLAWGIAPPRIVREIAARQRPSGLAPAAIIAAGAALDADSEIRATVRKVIYEKGRLFRQLRKLSMISPPYPSWSNFLLARIERGTADFFVPRLAERGIVVYRVGHPRLQQHLRVSGVSLDATTALKQALIEIALDL
ncbi:MAG TPA: aminotransferase class I/II-fold pyridoxal phosphate-dependent enzyme [Thermomicrobiales bacterium]|nr:aminotransferase class I/II-fold pyridoxal phosphate-dependent enzyme [Thermomicrobiales bacterium]